VSAVCPGPARVLAAAVAGWFSVANAPAYAGDTTDALPGVVRVPVAGPVDRSGVAVAASAGYGWTEGVLHEGDSHNRALGSLAVSVRPTPFFAAVLRLDGRYDSSLGPQSTRGWVGDPRLELRVGTLLGDAFRIGGQLNVWLPGNSAPSWVLDSTTPDASVLASYQRPDSPVTLASRAGFRWDNSARSAPAPDRLALSDRLSLGLNQASAVLVGLGIAVAVVPRVEGLADATWDLLVGGGSPGPSKSPILLSIGARYTLDPAGSWQLEAVATASPSERPTVAVGAPLVDVEPRVGGFINLVVRPAAPRREAGAVVPAQPPAPAPAPVLSPVRASLHGHILSETGHSPIAAAHLTIRSGSGPPRETHTDEQGAFEVEDLDLGEATVEVTADGFAPATRTVTLSASPAELEVSVAKALPSGQVRGLVRDFGGKPVMAAVRIEPLGVEVKLDRDGMFQADVAPGAYDVLIHAAGYVDQHRRVIVERDGVTMLNVELRKGR
jgi:hypothetical protein